MPRYPSEHKLETRRRIVETAGRRLKRDGIDGSGVATLMSDAGLTNGAFYAHFGSKSDLVATVVADQLVAQLAVVESLPAGRTAFADFVHAYLSPAHRDDAAQGCPSAALLDEISRCDADVRRAYDEGARRILDAIAARLAAEHGIDSGRAWERAVGIYAVLVSTVQLARAVADPELSQRVLDAGAASVLALVPAADDEVAP